MEQMTLEDAGRPRNVVLADDQPVFLRMLAHLVEAADDLRLVGTASDGGEAMALIERLEPDIAVLDVEMPVHDGPAIAARVAQLGLRTRILFLSAHRDNATIYDALATGGHGYVTKDAPMREIGAAVRRVAAGAVLTHDERSVLELAVQGLTLETMARRLDTAPATIAGRLEGLYAKLGVHDRASAVAEAIRRGLVA